MNTSSYTKIIGVGIGIIVFVFSLTTLPYTKITLQLADYNISEDVRITASTEREGTDVERRLMKARKIEKDITREIVIATTGAGKSEPQKARGTITIYNEYGPQAQPLVATTRFLAGDGTLFRLVNGVTVPGTHVDAEGNTVPGTIDALVEADVAGPEGNIAAETFLIPGFAGGPKAEKMYAKSTESMRGGSNGTDSIATVTEEDLANAKKEAEDGLDTHITEELQKLLRPDKEILLGDAWESEIIRSAPDVTVGTISRNVTHTVTAHVRAFVIDKAIVEGIAQDILTQKDASITDGNVHFAFQYKKSEIDFDNNQLIINMTASATRSGLVDEKVFRDRIVNKTHDELIEMVRTEYPTITNMTIKAVPSFPKFIAEHISARPWMTKIIMEK